LNASLAHIINLHKKLFLGLGWLGRNVLGFFSLFKREPREKILPVRGEHADETEEEEEEIEEPSPEPVKPTKEIEKEEEVEEEEAEEIIPQTIQIARPKRNYHLPSIDLLFSSKGKPTSGDIKSNAKIIEETFRNFGIDVEMGEIRIGPTVTQFSLKPAKGVKLTRITALQNDLSLALAAHPLRIEAPIPGQALVGIEVPNQKVAMVSLRELLESSEFKQRSHSMMVPLGKDVSGKVWLADLPKMPHLLIAGATGSGKTVGINTLILSLLFQNTPDTLRFIMVDPKRVELTLYNGIPHLLTPVITDAAKTVNALKWTISEMERRFDTLAAAGKRDIASYNKTSSDPLPYLVFVIDELADLMAIASKEVEAGIIRIAQMARAVGIHLVVATQRPSVEVITGLMKANIPGRMAFSVASLIDSRTILDCPGAEKLLGRGDMLLLTADLAKPKRIQGAFVSEEEMKQVVDFLKGDEPPIYDESIVSKNNSSGFASSVASFGGSDNDPMFEEAKQIVLESGKASASLLQRRMKVGYARAARLLDELQEAGVVGPADGAKPREVFTEHLRPEAEEELSSEEQSMGAGGAVFDEPKE
jgi:S-DNA-T family DNA segregation ATPase FtsK/SpoIIIE